MQLGENHGTVFLQQARAEGQAVFISFGTPFPIDTEQTLVTRFAHKLANASGN